MSRRGFDSMSSAAAPAAQWTRRRYAWEGRQYGAPAAAATEGPQDDGADTDVEALSPAECSAEFFNLLVSLKVKGVISAKQACLLSFWAKGGGLCEPGSKLALSPARSGGAFSAHFDRVVGLDEGMRADLYTLDVPGHERCTLGRSPVSHSAVLGYHALAQEIAATPDFYAKLDAKVLAGFWGDLYKAHPLMRGVRGQKVIPLALCMDGVQFQKRDSVTGFWLTNLVTDRRRLLFVLRRRLICRCGCVGWCSLYAVRFGLGARGHVGRCSPGDAA